MKTKILPTSVSVQRIEIGRITRWHVVCSDAEGREYTHEHPFDECGVHKAHRIADRVCEAGEIDVARWFCRVPYGTAAWDIDGMEVTLMDDEERFHRGM